jgi:hypothetical protein
MREKGITKVQLASTLNIHEKEVRRIPHPHHTTKLSTLLYDGDTRKRNRITNHNTIEFMRSITR